MVEDFLIAIACLLKLAQPSVSQLSLVIPKNRTEINVPKYVFVCDILRNYSFALLKFIFVRIVLLFEYFVAS